MPSNEADRELAAELERICASARFQKAPVLRDLLFYLHRAGETAGEYAAGVDVLGRKADFDPKTDATVRVHMGRLRQRLKDYYENEGRLAPIRVAIPAGTYRLAVEPVEPPGALSTQASLRRHLWVIAILLALCAALAWDSWNLRRRPVPAAPPALHPFWAGLADGGSTVNLVVPAPLFFLWPHVVIRDFNVNDPASLSASPVLKQVAEKLGPPEVSQLYTLVSDTVAAGTLSRYLGERGVTVTVLDTPTVSIDSLGARNAILFVGPGSVNQVSDLTEGMNFYLRTGTMAVLNRNPLEGEPKQWTEVQHAPQRVTTYGIVAKLHGRDPGKHVFVVASRYNIGLASFLTSPTKLDGLVKLHTEKGRPETFEAVIEFERNNEKILSARVLTLRPATR